MKSLFANRQYINPGIVPWVFIILSVIMLTTLGNWQMQRLTWKEGLLERIEVGQQLVPLTRLPVKLQPLDKSLYRRVKLTGELDRSTYFLRVGMHRTQGKGYSILSPFILYSFGGETKHVLVNRGFIAGEKEEIEAALKAETAQGPTIIEGILRPARRPRLFTPSNHEDKNIWLSEDIPAMEAALDKKLSAPPATLLPHVIDATAETPMQGSIAPVPKDVKVTFRNDHLTYAVTWFGLAITGVVMFYFFCTRRKEDQEKGSEES